MWKKKLSSSIQLSSALLSRVSIPPSSSSICIYHNCIYNSVLSHSQFSSHLSSSLKLIHKLYPVPFSYRVQNPSFRFCFCSAADKHAVDRCWNCKAVASHSAPFLFCDACRSIQPVDHTVDYFQIFGLEKKYDVEEGNLEGKYKNWQKKLHPDLVHSKSEEEREYAAEQSARVTTAYHTLTNPLSRAIYILKLEGVDVDEEGRITDLELLSEIMEIREAVEEAGDSQTLNQIREQMQTKMGHWSKLFGDAFRSREYVEALASIRRMTYYKRAIEEIVKKL